MPPTAVELLARHLRAGQVLTDAELIDRFVAGDEEAFADVLLRHGPMVRGVCLRLLGDPGQADDAFQATFLALARRAGSVRRGESVGSWLYGVAWRLARKARRASARRRLHERAAAEQRPAVSDPRWAELLSLLDEELTRLPEQLRAPLLLCYLQGLTQDEAARSLGWSYGTLRRRLERGRELLRARMEGRGAVLPGALFAAALMPGGATAVVSEGLLAETVRAAVRGAVPVGWSIGAKAAGLLLAAVVVTAGVTARAFFPAAQQAATPPSAARPVVAAADSLGDLLPEGALARFGSTRFRHPGTAFGMALSPDGKTLLTAGRHALRFLDPATGRARLTLADPHLSGLYIAGVPLLAFSRDGRLLLVSAVEGARLLDAATGAELWRSDGVKVAGGLGGLRGGLAGTGGGVAFSPDGKQFAVAGGGEVIFFDATGRKEYFRIPIVGKEEPRWLAYAPAGRLVALPGASAGAVRLCDAGTGKEVITFNNGVEVVAVAFAPDGKALAVAGKDTAVRLWDVATGKEARALRHELASLDPGLTALAFAPDGKVLAVAATDLSIRLWDPSNGKALRLLKGNVRRVTCLCFSRDGKTLYSTGWDQAVRRWDVRTGEEICGPEYDLDQSRMARSADGKVVATGGTDGPVTLWAAATGRRLRVLRGHEGGWLLELALSPDGRRLASCGPERTVRVWDVASGKVERSLDYGPVSKQQGQIESVAFSPDGRLLAACDSERHVVHLWDAASGKKLRDLAQPSPCALAFAPDGKTVAVGGWDRSVVLWTVATGRKSRSIVAGGTDQNTNAIAYSPNGRLLATGHHTDPIHLWDAATGELVRAIKTGHKLTWCLSFSPDGAWLATGGIDRTAALWEVATGRELHRLSGHESEVLNLAFGPDGRTLATGGFDRTSLLWTLKPKFSPLPAGGLASLWDDLRGEDAARAYRAVWAVAEHPEAVPFLKERLGRAGPAPGKARVRGLLDDLGSDEFARREAASRELAKMGTAAEAEARAAREKSGDPEVRRRLDALLKGLRRELSAEQLRQTRAASALRLIGGREAAEVLRGLEHR